MQTSWLLSRPAGDLVPAFRASQGARAFAALAPLVTAAGVAAVYSPKLVVQGAVGAVLVFVTFRWLLWATVLFVFLSFPVVLPAWLGAGATVSKPFGFVLVCSWLLLIIRDRRAVLLRDRPVLSAFMVAYLTLAIVSLLWTVDSGDTTYELERLVPVLFLTLVVYSVAQTRRDLLVLARGYVATSAVWAGYALATGKAIEGTRLTGGLNDPNYFASELILASLVAGFLIGATRTFIGRVLVAACVAIDVVSFVLTQSRGGVVGMAIGVAAAVVVAGRSRAVVVAVIAGALGLTIGYLALIAPAAVHQRITDLSASQSSGRTGSWEIAWQVFLHNPLHGVGLGAFRQAELGFVSSVNLQFVGQVLDQQLVAHNTYLETLAELGLPGMIFLGGIIVVVLAHARTALRASASARRPEADRQVLRGLVAGTAGLLGAFAFVSAEYEKSLWIMVGLIAAASRILLAESAPRAVEASPSRVRLVNAPLRAARSHL